MATTFIYALCEPGTRIVRYIGKSDNPKKRLIAHQSRSKTLDSHLGCWLRSLGDKTPAMIILKEVSQSDWESEEVLCIEFARALGMSLVNGSEGGEGVELTPEVLEKRRRALTGKKKTPEHCANMSAARLGVPHSKPRKLPPFSEAHKAIISRNTSGEGNPNFGKTGLANATFGTKTIGASSRYIGVSWNAARQDWTSRIPIGGKLQWLGRFKTEIAAARAYDNGAIRLLGPLVSVNFPL